MFQSIFGSFSTSVHHYAQDVGIAKKHEFVCCDLLTLRIVRAPPEDEDDQVWLIPDKEKQVWEGDEMVINKARICKAIDDKISLMPRHQDAKAIVTKMEMLYIDNPSNITLDIQITDDQATDWMGQQKYPVDALLCLPHNSQQLVDVDQRERYVSAFQDLGFDVLAFANMEENILAVEPDENDGVVVFKGSDLFGRFIHREKNTLQEGLPPGQIKQQEGLYVVKQELLEKTQRLFKQELFPMIQYTKGENILCEWALGQKDQEKLYAQYRETLERYDPAHVPTISVLIKTTYSVVTSTTKPVIVSKSSKISL